MLTQVACPSCGAGNRIASGNQTNKDFTKGKCGKCGAPLDLTTPIEVNDAGFARHLSTTKGHVIVDVWAPWCGPCKMMAPNCAAAAGDLAGAARLIKLNADESTSAGQLNVRGIPALIMFRDGKEVARQAGLMSREMIDEWARAQMQAST